MSDDLVIADRHGNVRSDFRKGKQPKTGPAYGTWAGRPMQQVMLPGGGMMQFDLNKLTLADYRGMRDHYQINASLTLLTFMMHQMDWSIDCKNKKNGQKLEDSLRNVWTRMIRAVSQAYWAGFSPIALEFENNAKSGMVEINKFKDLLPEECLVNWKPVDGATPPGASNYAKPKLYEFDGIKQLTGSAPIPVSHSFWYPLMMENGDYYGKKILRPAFPPWFFSQLIHMFANRYFERFGEPVPVGRAPFDDEIDLGDGKTLNGRDAMANILTSLRNRSVVVLPDNATSGMTSGTGKRDFDYQIEYLESQMRGADFERYLARLDEEMSLATFVPVLLLRTSDVGSYNLGIQHLQTYLWLLNALQGDLKDYVDRFIVRPLNIINFGENAPEASWEPRTMGRENVETMRAIAVELVRGGAAKPNYTELGQAIGLDLEEIGQIIAPDPNAPPQVAIDPTTGKPPPPAPVVVQPPGGNPKGVPPKGQPPRDKRSGRPNRTGTQSKPRGVNQPRATAKRISNRIAAQVGHNFTKHYWSMFTPDFGFHRQMAAAWELDGFDPIDAEQITHSIYGSLELWFADLLTLPMEAFTGLDQIVEMFNKVIEGQIEDFGGTDQ